MKHIKIKKAHLKGWEDAIEACKASEGDGIIVTFDAEGDGDPPVINPGHQGEEDN